MTEGTANRPWQLTKMSRRATSPTLRGDGRIRHTWSLRSTYTHRFTGHFTHFKAVRNCHEANRNGTSAARLGRPRGGGLQGSRHASRTTVQVRFSRNGLGTGGATSSIRQGPGDGGTAKYLFVGLCLSQRAGAAGSERALPPGESSIALERELEQRPDAAITPVCTILGGRSEHPSSRSAQTCRTVGETPARFREPGDDAAAGRRRRVTRRPEGDAGWGKGP